MFLGRSAIHLFGNLHSTNVHSHWLAYRPISAALSIYFRHRKQKIELDSKLACMKTAHTPRVISSKPLMKKRSYEFQLGIDGCVPVPYRYGYMCTGTERS